MHKIHLFIKQVNLKIKFPCEMHLRFDGQKITRSVSMSQSIDRSADPQGKAFIFRQEVELTVGGSSKEEVILNLHLTTVKGSEYKAGEIRLSKQMLQGEKDSPAIVSVEKSLDSEASCQLIVMNIQESSIQKEKSEFLVETFNPSHYTVSPFNIDEGSREHQETPNNQKKHNLVTKDSKESEKELVDYLQKNMGHEKFKEEDSFIYEMDVLDDKPESKSKLFENFAESANSFDQKSEQNKFGHDRNESNDGSALEIRLSSPGKDQTPIIKNYDSLKVEGSFMQESRVSNSELSRSRVSRLRKYESMVRINFNGEQNSLRKSFVGNGKCANCKGLEQEVSELRLSIEGYEKKVSILRSEQSENGILRQEVQLKEHTIKVLQERAKHCTSESLKLQQELQAANLSNLKLEALVVEKEERIFDIGQQLHLLESHLQIKEEELDQKQECTESLRREIRDMRRSISKLTSQVSDYELTIQSELTPEIQALKKQLQDNKITITSLNMSLQGSRRQKSQYEELYKELIDKNEKELKESKAKKQEKIHELHNLLTAQESRSEQLRRTIEELNEKILQSQPNAVDQVAQQKLGTFPSKDSLQLLRSKCDQLQFCYRQSVQKSRNQNDLIETLQQKNHQLLSEIQSLKSKGQCMKSQSQQKEKQYQTHIQNLQRDLKSSELKLKESDTLISNLQRTVKKGSEQPQKVDQASQNFALPSPADRRVSDATKKNSPTERKSHKYCQIETQLRQQQYERRQNQLKAAKVEIDKLTLENKDLKQDLSHLEKTIQYLKKQVIKSREEIYKLKDEPNYKSLSLIDQKNLEDSITTKILSRSQIVIKGHNGESGKKQQSWSSLIEESESGYTSDSQVIEKIISAKDKEIREMQAQLQVTELEMYKIEKQLRLSRQSVDFLQDEKNRLASELSDEKGRYGKLMQAQHQTEMKNSHLKYEVQELKEKHSLLERECQSKIEELEQNVDELQTEKEARLREANLKCKEVAEQLFATEEARNQIQLQFQRKSREERALKEQIQKVLKDKTALRNELHESEQTIVKAREQTSHFSRKFNNIAQSEKSLEAEIGTLHQKIALLHSEIEEIQKTQKVQKEHISELQQQVRKKNDIGRSLSLKLVEQTENLQSSQRELDSFAKMALSNLLQFERSVMEDLLKSNAESFSQSIRSKQQRPTHSRSCSQIVNGYTSFSFKGPSLNQEAESIEDDEISTILQNNERTVQDPLSPSKIFGSISGVHSRYEQEVFQAINDQKSKEHQEQQQNFVSNMSVGLKQSILGQSNVFLPEGAMIQPETSQNDSLVSGLYRTHQSCILENSDVDQKIGTRNRQNISTFISHQQKCFSKVRRQIRYFIGQYHALELQNAQQTQTIKEQLGQIKKLQMELESQQNQFQEWISKMEHKLNENEREREPYSRSELMGLENQLREAYDKVDQSELTIEKLSIQNKKFDRKIKQMEKASQESRSVRDGLEEQLLNKKNELKEVNYSHFLAEQQFGAEKKILTQKLNMANMHILNLESQVCRLESELKELRQEHSTMLEYSEKEHQYLRDQINALEDDLNRELKSKGRGVCERQEVEKLKSQIMKLKRQAKMRDMSASIILKEKDEELEKWKMLSSQPLETINEKKTPKQKPPQHKAINSLFKNAASIESEEAGSDYESESLHESRGETAGKIKFPPLLLQSHQIRRADSIQVEIPPASEKFLHSSFENDLTAHYRQSLSSNSGVKNQVLSRINSLLPPPSMKHSKIDFKAEGQDFDSKVSQPQPEIRMTTSIEETVPQKDFEDKGLHQKLSSRMFRQPLEMRIAESIGIEQYEFRVKEQELNGQGDVCSEKPLADQENSQFQSEFERLLNN